jgi:hypothetical protein
VPVARNSFSVIGTRARSVSDIPTAGTLLERIGAGACFPKRFQLFEWGVSRDRHQQIIVNHRASDRFPDNNPNRTVIGLGLSLDRERKNVAASAKKILGSGVLRVINGLGVYLEEIEASGLGRELLQQSRALVFPIYAVNANDELTHIWAVDFQPEEARPSIQR